MNSSTSCRCPRCGCVMMPLGNVSGRTLLSLPPQWDEVFVCHGCRVKKTVRVRGNPEPDFSWLDKYEDVE